MSADPQVVLGLEPGIHPGLSEAIYHADALCSVPTLSNSIAKVLIDESPLHAWAKHARLGNKVQRTDPTPAMEYGLAAHALSLGKGAELAICDADSWRGKAGDFRDEARANGQIPILAHKLEKAKAQSAALFNQLTEMGLAAGFFRARPEVALLYDDGSVRCRARLDKLDIDENAGKAVIYDLKTTDSANPSGLGRLIFNQHYDMQERSYTGGLANVRKDLAGRIDFIFLFQETEYPFCLTPVRLTGEQQMLGTSKWTRAWQMWEACLRTGIWPGYTDKIVTTEAPGFALNSELGKSAIMPTRAEMAADIARAREFSAQQNAP